jgi:hypothetical protein
MMPASFKSLAVTTICGALFTSNPESPIAGWCCKYGLDQLFRRYLDAQIHHVVADVVPDLNRLQPIEFRRQQRRVQVREYSKCLPIVVSSLIY